MEEMKDHLNILWTTGERETSENMVLMYGHNAKRIGWWGSVTIIIWGCSAKLVARDARIRERISTMMGDGVEFSACKACADLMGVSDRLEDLGIEVKYWGAPLTKILKENGALLTV